MPRTLLTRKSPRFSSRINLARNRSLKALADMRHGASLSRAARENNVSQKTIKRYIGSTLVQDRPGGRFRARKSDRLVRYLQIPGPNGTVEVTARGLKEASEFARYKVAVNRFLGGELSALAPWQGKKIGGIELLTDAGTIKKQAKNESLPYSLYRSLSGGAA
jgi:hypothetical protein